MPLPTRHSRNFLWTMAMICCLIHLGGCAPMVMLGKMLQGDPLVDDEFKKWNGKSLAKSGKQVAILVSTPESIKSEYASLDIDLLSEISRKLATQQIAVVKPHKVATWIDDHGWEDMDLKELGTDIDADYVIQVKLDHFDYREENSPNLFRGRTNGVITAYELIRAPKPKSTIKSGLGFGKSDSKDKDDDKSKDSEKDKGNKKSKESDSKSETSEKDHKNSDDKEKEKRGPVTSLRKVYNRTFQNVYPIHQPVSIEQMQPETFKKKFLDHVSDDLSKLFYAHKAGSGF